MWNHHLFEITRLSETADFPDAYQCALSLEHIADTVYSETALQGIVQSVVRKKVWDVLDFIVTNDHERVRETVKTRLVREALENTNLPDWVRAYSCFHIARNRDLVKSVVYNVSVGIDTPFLDRIKKTMGGDMGNIDATALYFIDHAIAILEESIHGKASHSETLFDGPEIAILCGCYYQLHRWGVSPEFLNKSEASFLDILEDILRVGQEYFDLWRGRLSEIPEWESEIAAQIVVGSCQHGKKREEFETRRNELLSMTADSFLKSVFHTENLINTLKRLQSKK